MTHEPDDFQIENLRHALREALELPLSKEGKKLLLEVLQVLDGLAPGEEARDALERFWLDKALTLEVHENSDSRSPQAVVAQLMREAREDAQQGRPRDGVRGPGRPRRNDTDPAAKAAKELTDRIRRGAGRRPGGY